MSPEERRWKEAEEHQKKQLQEINRLVVVAQGLLETCRLDLERIKRLEQRDQ